MARSGSDDELAKKPLVCRTGRLRDMIELASEVGAVEPDSAEKAEMVDCERRIERVDMSEAIDGALASEGAVGDRRTTGSPALISGRSQPNASASGVGVSEMMLALGERR